jgi:putative membrane protein
MHRTRLLFAALLILVGILMASGLHPHDRPTWALEVLPVLLVLPVLWATHRRFPLTPLLYSLIFVHCIVLIVGGMHTYARVPFGFQLQEWLDLARNPYDKIGHFFQGLVPAIAAREILLRGRYVNGDRMRVFIILSIVLAVSATYELLEWLTAVLFGQGAYEFLGTQGDPWDAQSDMLFAVIGCVCALVLLTGVHDRQIERLERELAPQSGNSG